MADGRELIDGLRRADGTLDRAALRKILPYGEEFLFVDRVERLTEEEVEASFRVPDDAPYLRAHFVGLPLMPGVLIGEGMAQAGTVLVRYRLEDPASRDLLALEIERARFHSPARPGDALDFRVRLVTADSRAARLEGRATVGGRTVCRARLVLAIVERQTLRAHLAAADSA